MSAYVCVSSAVQITERDDFSFSTASRKKKKERIRWDRRVWGTSAGGGDISRRRIKERYSRSKELTERFVLTALSPPSTPPWCRHQSVRRANL